MLSTLYLTKPDSMIHQWKQHCYLYWQKRRHKKLVDIKIPHGIIISCILRNDNMIVPNGSTVILPNDKLLIISSPADQQKAIDIISGGLK